MLFKHLKYDYCATLLSESVGIIAKIRTLKVIGYGTYTKLINSNVVPILDYGAAMGER